MLIHEENKYVHKDVLNNMTRQQRYGVISGIVVEAQDTPDMSIKISAGEYLFNGNKISFAGELNLSIDAADPDLNRYDLIVLDDSGNVSVLSGIESLSDDDPTLTGPLPINDYDPDTYLPIARIFVGAGVNEIIGSNIKDIRVLIFEQEKYNVPVGSIIPWLKTLLAVDDGTNTSTTTNKLIDSSATFISSGVSAGNIVQIADESLIGEYLTEWSIAGYSHYYTVTTFNFDSLKIKKLTTEIRSDTGSHGYCQVIFNYSDSTSETSAELSTYATTYTEYTFTNPNPSKEITSIVVQAKNAGSGYYTYVRNNRVYSLADKTKIISVDSETQLTLTKDLLPLSSIQYYIYIAEPITANWAECNGQTLNDVESPLNGITIPDLNGDNNFLRGSTTSGGTGTLAATGSADIPYYNVVFIMRIK